MNEYLSKLTPEQAREVPMVDLAFNILKAANTPFYYRDLMNEVAKIKGYTEEDVLRLIAQLYTEINVDGRFACVGNNLWGLKRWYPVDNKEGEMGGTKRPRIINDDDDDLDEEEYMDEEEESFPAEEEDFDSFDEDHEEVAEEEDDMFAPDEIEEELDETEEIQDLDEELEESEEEDSEFEDDLDEGDEDDK